MYWEGKIVFDRQVALFARFGSDHCSSALYQIGDWPPRGRPVPSARDRQFGNTGWDGPYVPASAFRGTQCEGWGACVLLKVSVDGKEIRLSEIPFLEAGIEYDVVGIFDDAPYSISGRYVSPYDEVRDRICREAVARSALADRVTLAERPSDVDPRRGVFRTWEDAAACYGLLTTEEWESLP